MPACAYVPATGETVSTLIAFFDCQSRTIGAVGFRTLAASGSTASLLLTALLTIVVALFGFRLLLDETPTLRDLVLTLVKVGVVLALASSWSAYRTVAYDVVIQGPRQLAAELSGPLDLPGFDGSFSRRLDNIDREFETLEALSTGRVVSETATFGTRGHTTSGFDRLALSLARATFLLTAVGAFALLGLAAGLLLALGPIFITFLLFAATRGLVEGWLRALISILLATIMTIIMLSVELAVLEPWLADLIGRRAGGETIVSAATPLLATAVVFGIALTAFLLLSSRIGFSLRLPSSGCFHSTPPARATTALTAPVTELGPATAAAAPGLSRASLVADSVAARLRREEHAHQASVAKSPQSTNNGARVPSGGDRLSAPVPLGHSFRRTNRRMSLSTRARDRRS